MEDDLKEKKKKIFSQFLLNLGGNGRRPKKWKKMEDNLKKMKKMEDDQKKSKIFSQFILNLGANLSWDWLSSLKIFSFKCIENLMSFWIFPYRVWMKAK
jgi:hypothetical protein